MFPWEAERAVQGMRRKGHLYSWTAQRAMQRVQRNRREEERRGGSRAKGSAGAAGAAGSADGPCGAHGSAHLCRHVRPRCHVGQGHSAPRCGWHNFRKSCPCCQYCGGCRCYSSWPRISSRPCFPPSSCRRCHCNETGNCGPCSSTAACSRWCCFRCSGCGWPCFTAASCRWCHHGGPCLTASSCRQWHRCRPGVSSEPGLKVCTGGGPIVCTGPGLNAPGCRRCHRDGPCLHDGHRHAREKCGRESILRRYHSYHSNRKRCCHCFCVRCKSRNCVGARQSPSP